MKIKCGLIYPSIYLSVLFWHFPPCRITWCHMSYHKPLISRFINVRASSSCLAASTRHKTSTVARCQNSLAQSRLCGPEVKYRSKITTYRGSYFPVIHQQIVYYVIYISYFSGTFMSVTVEKHCRPGQQQQEHCYLFFLHTTMKRHQDIIQNEH